MTTIELPPLNFADHPDCIGGIVWTPMELAAIRKYATAAIEQDRARRAAPCVSSENHLQDATSARAQVAADGEREQRAYNPPDAGGCVQHAGNSARPGEDELMRLAETMAESIAPGARYKLTMGKDVMVARGALRAAIRQALRQPASEPVVYPQGEVIGPCICGSWPGGKCFRCRRIDAAPPSAEITQEDRERARVAIADLESWPQENQFSSRFYEAAALLRKAYIK